MKREKPDDCPDRSKASSSEVALAEAWVSGDVEVIDFVDDDSIMQDMLDMLRNERSVHRGTRIAPEPPRLVAKVCEAEGRGEIWLGPLPTEDRIPHIMHTDFSIQVYCFRSDPEDVEVVQGGEMGMRIPGAMVFDCEMSN